jgi:adiponectin receptor
LTESEEDEVPFFVGTAAHAPNFMLYNPYIKRGFRINFNSHTKLFKSLFMLHNETINVWTHLIGAIFFSYIVFMTRIDY